MSLDNLFEMYTFKVPKVNDCSAMLPMMSLYRVFFKFAVLIDFLALVL